MEPRIKPFPDAAQVRLPQNHQIAARVIGLALGEVEALLKVAWDDDYAASANHRLEILLGWLPYMQVAQIATAPQREQS